MKKIMPLAIPAIIIAGWFGYMSQDNKPEMDLEMNVRVCTNMSINAANEYADSNMYALSGEALDAMREAASEQCKRTVAKVTSEVIDYDVEKIFKAKRMFNDGLDYEEQKTVRYTVEMAEVYGKEFGKMSKREMKAWAIKYQQQNNH